MFSAGLSRLVKGHKAILGTDQNYYILENNSVDMDFDVEFPMLSA
jgi:hypothetical protein